MRGRRFQGAGFLSVVILLAACGPGTGHELEDRIARSEAKLAPRLAAEQMDVSDETTALIQELLRDYAAYINRHHGDSLSHGYGMRRADLLLGKGDAESAIQQWVDVVGGGAPEDMAAEAMFRIGLARETALKDTVAALKAYTELIRLYPESQWAEPAGEAAKWLTFSEQEFIRALGLGTEGRD